MHPSELAIEEHSYELPLDRIAQRPLAERDASKMLVFRDGRISDHPFRELPDLLPANSLLVLNNTRVVNARLLFRRATGARIEVLCLEPAGQLSMEQAMSATAFCEWYGLLGNSSKWKEEEALELKSNGIELRARRVGQDRVRFEWSPFTATFAEVLDKLGHVPLPPYMTRPDEGLDRERYNTVFSSVDGSVAAPTASLHLTHPLIDQLRERSIRTTEVTLHVGAGTFLPVKSTRMKDHAMHSEQVRIPIKTIEALIGQIGHGMVVPVGTTAMRTIESLYWHGVQVLAGKAKVEMDVEQWEPYDIDRTLPLAKEALQAVLDRTTSAGEGECTGRTRLLIAPGYKFHIADALITNFHQPRSTLLLLVAAFLGAEWRRVYDHALNNGYRFLSYGDGSLLFKNDLKASFSVAT